MKILRNRKYGGYSISENVLDKVGIDREDIGWPRYSDIMFGYSDRDNPKLIDFFEHRPEYLGDLEVVEVPDEATDYRIFDYDGAETVFYVVNGHIFEI